MVAFKCKMCGGTIEFNEGDTIGVCAYCGTKQTLPNISDDIIANLFARANALRLKCEFDKAEEIYNKILEKDNTVAEAHWGIILCKYGIEYVDDSKTGKKIPTCHRTSYDSIIADEDYKAAIACGSEEQRQIYEVEAKEIDRIQKDILAIVKDEKPFDVFICYKETDENGKRTQDSVIANDIYYLLTQEGFKVFYAAITLEDKIGREYEPYIFAALNSAKAMLVVGSKPEYFNAVWVKNEWSRFLKLMKTHRSKLLIPCYRDMDAYELPEEFAHLQAQDMSKIGFINDITRGIRKVLPDTKPEASTSAPTASANANITPLLERAFMFLKDGEWDKADDFCEQVLNQDPKNASAYLGKLMAEFHVKQKADLDKLDLTFDDRNNYQKAITFGDRQLKDFLETCNKEIIFNKALIMMRNAYNENLYINAALEFHKIFDYKNAKDLAAECYEKAGQEKQRAERKAEERRIVAEKAAKKRKKAFAIGTPIVAVCIAFVIVLITVIMPNIRFKNLKSGNYDVGGTVKFGNYHNSDEWIVLDKQENRMLLISKYALDCQPYNTSIIDVTWESCSLRKWLNDDFLNEAFSKKEQSIIAKTDISADKNPEYSTNPGNVKTDKVFLLSITEAKKYFSSDSARQCKPTEYAVANGAYVSSNNGNCWWWLRSPGNTQNYAARVHTDGSVIYGGDYVNYDFDCVRPALWINLDS